MEENALYCVSPIDGRYRNSTKRLRVYFSEYSLILYRIRIEIEYFIHLTTILPELQNITDNDIIKLRSIYANFNNSICKKIKCIEQDINHDVKAIEYYIQEEFSNIGLSKYIPFIHFALTSNDINSIAINLSIKECVSVILIPTIDDIIKKIMEKSTDWCNCVMLSHTHGQPAVPTTMGKELLVFSYRLNKQLSMLKGLKYFAKFGGAVGNLNGHLVAYPYIQWEKEFDKFLETFNLKRDALTTQIDNYENISTIFDNIKRINLILIDMCKDIWHYISINYFSQKLNYNEVGSSTMPHKINPINFENSEGNLLLSNALLEFMSSKLPISRLQRDLTDSTVIRNIGSTIGHAFIGYNNIMFGLDKLEINNSKVQEDLNDNVQVLVEAYQIILKKHNYSGAYELFKNLTRGQKNIRFSDLQNFINGLTVSKEIKKELLHVTINNYIGISTEISKNY
jgi:adenylosuccinate lyase